MRGRPFQLFMLVWALAALLLVQRLFFAGPSGEPGPTGVVVAGSASADADAWYQRIERRCVEGEALRAIESDPAPRTFEGIAFEAACLGLAGEVDKARARIEGLEGGRRALYHAGSARYRSGDFEEARGYLERFVTEYRIDDAWSRDARSMLEEIGG